MIEAEEAVSEVFEVDLAVFAGDHGAGVGKVAFLPWLDGAAAWNAVGFLALALWTRDDGDALENLFLG